MYLNAVKAIGLQNSKTYLHAAFVQEGNRISIKETIFYSIFSALFIAVCYIAAQAGKCGICTKQLKRSLFKCREGYRITKLKDLSSRSVCARRKPNFY